MDLGFSCFLEVRPTISIANASICEAKYLETPILLYCGIVASDWKRLKLQSVPSKEQHQRRNQPLLELFLTPIIVKDGALFDLVPKVHLERSTPQIIVMLLERLNTTDIRNPLINPDGGLMFPPSDLYCKQSVTLIGRRAQHA